MDGPLITALVDMWRPETHSFHLACGEMSVMMQDASMILGLPLNRQAVSCRHRKLEGHEITKLGMQPERAPFQNYMVHAWTYLRFSESRQSVMLHHRLRAGNPASTPIQ